MVLSRLACILIRVYVPQVDRLAAASHDQDVFSQRAPRTLRGAGDGDADSAPVFFWLLDARQAVTAQSPGAPALPPRPLGGQQPRDGRKCLRRGD